MRDDWLKEQGNRLRLWGIVAPLILIALCLVIGLQEGFAAAWESSVLPVILSVAAMIFLSLNIPAYFLHVSSDKMDDGKE